MRGLGTLINVATIVAGTAAGLAVGARIPERTRTTILQGVGLVTLVLGVMQGMETRNLVFPLVALVLGGLVGEALGIEERLESLGDAIRRRVERPADPAVEGAPHADPGDAGESRKDTRFVEGFVAASLLFGVGPMAILGSLQDGLSGNVQLLVVKASLDGLVSVIFASTLGWGVGFSALPVLVYQGALTLLAGAADRVLTERMIVELTATGGMIVLGISLRLLDLKQVRVASFLPALAFAPIGVALFAR